MKLKKVLLGFAAFTLSLSLAACSSNDSEKVSTEKETPQASTDVEKKTEQKESTKEKTADKSKEKDKKELVDVTLDRAVDGDTIKVTYNGNVDTVRYLLIDTPETKKPNSCVQPYGEDASKRNKELVNSGKLQLEFDKGDRRDKYGRLLAYGTCRSAAHCSAFKQCGVFVFLCQIISNCGTDNSASNHHCFIMPFHSASPLACGNIVWLLPKVQRKRKFLT